VLASECGLLFGSNSPGATAEEHLRWLQARMSLGCEQFSSHRDSCSLPLQNKPGKSAAAPSQSCCGPSRQPNAVSVCWVDLFEM